MNKKRTTFVHAISTTRKNTHIMQITSLNPKNQKAVNKAVNYLDKYNSTSSARDRAYDNDDEREGRKLDRKCEDLFDKYLTACDELPKRERENIEKKFYN